MITQIGVKAAQSMPVVESTYVSRMVARTFCAALAFFGVNGVGAQGFDVSQVPLFLGGTIDPNLLYIHDDSGSMYWSFMPDDVSSSRGRRRTRWSGFNTVYYDPAVIYLPPRNHLGNSLGDASFTSAWFNGYMLDASGMHNSTTVNLSTSFQATWYYVGDLEYEGTVQPAYYYRYTGGAGCNIERPADECLTKVVVSATSGPGTKDMNRDGAIDALDKDERQNFANWYSYYRTRNYAAKAGVSRAFATLGEGLRVGYGRINKGTTSTIDGKSVNTVVQGVRAFTGTGRKNFFDWLFGVNPTGNTPLRRALDGAGQYYENGSELSAWSTTPGVAGGNSLSCRQSYTILMTDGYWNDAAASTDEARQNVDGTAGPTITGPDGASYSYSAISPFVDGEPNTLADVAMYYWKRDLREDLANRVPVSVTDPAFWQHMVTFGIGLGVTGTVNPESAFAAIESGAEITWPPASSNQVDDLLHASVNGRGGFFSAKNPDEFATALTETLAKIGERTASAAAVATNSNRLSSGSLIYEVTFESEGWTGEIAAYSLNTTTGLPAATPTWQASSLIPSVGSRKIFSWRPDTSPAAGVNFVWASLSDVQKAALQSEAVLNWVRGDQTNERARGGSLRDRAKRLGDIVNSDPYFVGTEDYGYGSSGVLAEEVRAAYVTRKLSTAFRNRTKMLYVGSNDGMLHGFNAETGVEEFAYVPNLIGFANLYSLAQPDYSHRYLVDGAPRVGDAYIDGAWRSVLVGSTGAGGKGYFALNVENPGSMDASKVMWEFTHPELGQAIGQASIVVGENGQWLAIFGNGYNSGSQKAQLFIVDLATGVLVKKIDTGVGTVGAPNGLATPLAIDTNQNGAVDLVYAGDMHGNLWKFDLSGANVSSWGVPFKDGSTPRPLFVAQYGTAMERQPITSKPQAARNPTGGVIVYFGTGQFFEVGDQADMRVQSFYGVIDKCGTNSTGACAKSRDSDGASDMCVGNAHICIVDLLQQRIEQELVGTYGDVTWESRVTSDEMLGDGDKGFYLNLISPTDGEQGERVVSAPLIWDDRVIFVTQIPDPDPCAYGGESWIMELDPKSGSRTTFSVFDMNADGRFNDGDKLGSDVVSGRKVPGGMAKTPATISGPGATYKYTMGSAAVLGVTANKLSIGIGRQSWRQLR